MARQALPDLSIVLAFLRSAQGWSQAELGEAAGISSNHLADYERGRRPLKRGRLEQLLACMSLPPETIDTVLACLVASRAAGKAPHNPADPLAQVRREVEAVAVQAGRLATDFARSVIGLLAFEGDALRARRSAANLWARLKRRTAEQRRLLVDEGREYRSWALCERVAAESIEVAANHPGKALELGGLALRMAELAPGEAAWRSRLQGYAWAHLANARRVNSDLPGADEAMARAWKLWQAGAAADPGLLNPAWLPWIDSVLRMDQRRFREALRRIEEALEIDQGELRGRILLGKSSLLQILGNAAGSTATLLEAAPLIDADSEPRAAFGLRFNLLVNLCHLGRAAEAEPRLPEIRELAERMGEELDLVRVVWLEGKVGAGLGRTEAARAAFEQVRREFTTRQIAFDCALASLDLALLLLDEGRTAEVRTLAGEMLWIFRSQGVHREALAALRIFCDAAKRETATAELARRVIAFLYRAQDDPELRFQATTSKGE